MDVTKLILALFLLVLVAVVHAGDMLRKSIVFDKKTPGVFYCPQHKPTGIDKMIVRSRPLKKLCEFDGKKPLPADYKSDCYQDIDESEYACKEKYRIMVTTTADRLLAELSQNGTKVPERRLNRETP